MKMISLAVVLLGLMVGVLMTEEPPLCPQTELVRNVEIPGFECVTDLCIEKTYGVEVALHDTPN